MEERKSSVAVLYKCDGCDEIYDSYTQAYECHLPLEYQPTYWEQMMLSDELTEQAEMDCA